MSDEKTPREPTDWSRIPTQFIPPDDPIFTEGVIITFPIRPRPDEANTDDEKKESP